MSRVEMAPSNIQVRPGICALLGSGETTSVGRRVLSTLLHQIDEPRQIVVLDTPAGFQPNHRQVAENIARFLTEKLAELRPQPTIVETRRTTHDTTIEAKALNILAHANCIIAGPGSPTYMINELVETAYLEAIRQAHANGTTLYVSSAASIALSAFSLPVYEIFKVGEDPHWKTGLDFFGPFGMSLAIIPHWNNNEGGATVDTRFCYMGQARFEIMRRQLPPEVALLGIDEHTACILDFAAELASVTGKGGVHLMRDGLLMEWASGETFPLSYLGAHQLPPPSNDEHPSLYLDALPSPATTLDPLIEEDALAQKIPPQLIEAILALRTDLRQARQWKWADQLRDALATCDIIVEDTPTGTQWHITDND